MSAVRPLTLFLLSLILASSPHGSGGYRVGVICKSGVPFFGPRLPAGGVFARDCDFREWLVLKCINGERASMHSKEFLSNAVRTKHALLAEALHDTTSGLTVRQPRRPHERASRTQPLKAADPNDPQELQRRLLELRGESLSSSPKNAAQFFSVQIASRARPQLWMGYASLQASTARTPKPRRTRRRRSRSRKAPLPTCSAKLASLSRSLAAARQR